ncbi:serine/threonine protein phosphatase [Altererythrobacter xixiisoli]|uniref:Serine/threonine protein phosphatase n=1 Tax=Croceibacterium xixiisoli TaxID=1476466 RepID=A0A6I4TSI8_9SPHN|nr:metallophosphoesterase [Croceibacterium xixiisoli]MXO98091.1 serine/threonine protein phosphatase [Croceibacterium xixiisoli]
MFKGIKNLFSRTVETPPPVLPSGERVYAVGDVHGRLDLLQALAQAIETDDAARGRANTTIVMLGDLVDRGPDSAGVIRFVRDWQARRKVHVLGGNHEEMFLDSLTDLNVFKHFLRHGGRETVLSFGVNAESFRDASMEEAHELMCATVPVEDIEYLRNLEDWVTIGDYLFVHAGIEPGVPLANQQRHTFRWIREPFLSHADSHGLVVVHGHTITRAPEDRGNRIGIDTGAYQSGRLTALVLEGRNRSFMEAFEQEDGSITAGPVPILA